MREPIRKIALITHQLPSVAADTLDEVMQLLEEREVEVLLPPGERAKHPKPLAGRKACCETSREELNEAQMVLVLGGDGTVLRALRYTRGLGVPVVGVNLGKVGFFAAVPRDRVGEDLARVLNGDYTEHSLLGLETRLDGATFQAVNDILIGHGSETGVARLTYSINEVPLFDVRCDGLLVSTPAGSTAYNLAVNGPILSVGMQGYIVSFVAPHSLATRSLVAADDDVLSVSNRSSHQPVQVVVDGDHVGSMNPLTAIEVRVVPDVATLLLLPESDFFSHFRERFIEARPG